MTDVPPPTGRPSRRGFLLGTGLAVVSAGGGVAAGLLVTRPKPDEVTAPAELVAAADAERVLIAALDASLADNPGLAPVLRQVRADHAAHLGALAASVAAVVGVPSESASPTGPSTPPAALDSAGLRRAEQLAAKTAAARALRVGGTEAALLASIAACEATHVELLS